MSDKIQEDLNERTKLQAEVFNFKFCPFVAGPCIKEQCWSYRGGLTFWTMDEEKDVPIPGTKTRKDFVMSDKVYCGERASCRLDIYPDWILSMEVAPPTYKVDKMTGNVVGPDGAFLKDKSEEEIAALFNQRAMTPEQLAALKEKMDGIL
jgi:hypothetical protein